MKIGEMPPVELNCLDCGIPINGNICECGAILLPEELRVCNCAACKKLLCGMNQRNWFWKLPRLEREKLPPMTSGHIQGRPFCQLCLLYAWKNGDPDMPSPV